jgi:hypothetical protein
VTDYAVTLKFHEGRLSSEHEAILKNALGLRTSLVPRARLIASSLSPFELIDAIRKKNHVVIERIRNEAGEAVFTATEAKNYLQMLNQRRHMFDLERCDFHDRPELTITKEMVRGGKIEYVTRNFS